MTGGRKESFQTAPSRGAETRVRGGGSLPQPIGGGGGGAVSREVSFAGAGAERSPGPTRTLGARVPRGGARGSSGSSGQALARGAWGGGVAGPR